MPTTPRGGPGVPTGRRRRRTEVRTSTGSELPIGVLLGAAALLAAIFAALAAGSMNRAEDRWQQSIRLDAKRAAAASEDIRVVYQEEAPTAFDAANNLAVSQALLRASQSKSGAVRSTMLAEASVDFDTARA